MSVKPDYEALFHAYPFPYVLLDPQLTIVDANQAYLDATGARGEDIIGRYAFSAFPPNPDDPDSTNMREVHASVARVVATGRPNNTPLLRYAMRREGPAGPVFEDRYWSLLHTPVVNAAGEVAYVGQHTVDVTDLYERRGARGNPAEGFAAFARARMEEAMVRALSDETSHLRNLFKQAPGFAAVLKGRDAIFDMVNEAYYQLVGHREILGKPLLQALPEIAGQGYETLIEQVFSTGLPYVGHGALVSVQRVPDGPASDRYVDFVFQPIVEGNGEVAGIFVQGHDVTEAHEAQLAREKADQRLREGMETARMAVWDWDLASGRFDCSENTLAVFGARWTDIDTVRRCVHRDDVAQVEAAVARALETRSGYSIVARLVRPDNGELVWVHSRGQVLCDAQGDARAVRGVTVDISERKRAELELERVNRALAERVQQLAVAERRQAFQLEVSDRLRRARDADTVNLEVCQLLGRHLGASRVNFGEYDTERRLVTYRSYYADGVASEQSAFPAEAFGAANLAVIAAGETWVNDDLEHDPRTCSADIWPMFKARGVYAGMMVPMNRRSGVVSCLFVQHASARRWSAEEIALVEDISQRMWNAMERVRAEEALRQADTRKDEFLAMLAHELRNPLAPISAAAELLRIGRLDPDSIRRTSQVIGRQVGHMTGLVNDLLDVSRVTRGLVELERQPLDLARVIADAVEQIRPLVEARRHHLSIRAAPGLAGLEGDHKRMVQVLANLLANAAKYTPEGGEIELCAEGVAGAVVLRVADNGSGIPAEVLPHVFDLFSQAKRTPDRSQGGLGLGLALVRSLVELHGGSVSAHSDGPGQGAEFRLWLPCAAPRERRQAGADAHDARAWFAPPMRLLIVDDNADAAGMLKLLLESSGHDVVVENSPFPALERASAERFDALLLDIGLPGMDGRELARRMRESGQSRTAVFMAVTGYGQQHDGASANDSAFDHYFVKPVDAGGLLAVLAEVHRARSSHA